MGKIVFTKLTIKECLECVIDNRGKTPPLVEDMTEYELLEVNSIVGECREPDYSVVKKYVDYNTYKTWFRNGHPKTGDILFSTVGSIAEVALLKENRGSIAQNLIALRAKSSLIDYNYLYYYLKNPKFKSELMSLDISSVQPSIKVPHLLATKIKIPNIRVQIEFASILSSLDEKIELNRKINETLEEMARAIFKSWFVDFDPVHAKARGEKPAGMPDEIADFFPSEFVHSDLLGKPIPKGWEVKSLKELIDFNPHRQIKKGSVVPYIEMSSLPEQGMSIKGFYDREFKSGSKFKNGDTLFARITPCLENGKTAFVDCLKDDEIGWGSTEFIVMRSKPIIGGFFSYLVARSEWFRTVAIGSMNGSSGRQRASKEALEELLMAVPNENILKAFNEITALIPAKIKAAHDESNTLRELRDSLLPKLISGEIEV